MDKQYVIVRKAPVAVAPLDHAAKKRWIVILLLAYAALSGVIICFLPEHDTPVDYLVGLPFLLLGLSWCFVDASERNHRIGKLTKLLLVFVFVIGFPLYVIQSQGIRGVKTLGLAFLLIVGILACVYVSSLAMLYAGGSLGLWEVAGSVECCSGCSFA